ncbi:MAG: serine/threonine-protein kinase [Pseudomonadota bacterium]
MPAKSFEEKTFEKLINARQRVNDRYTIVKEIAKGGQGIIYLARDADNREVALKVLKIPTLKNDEASIKSFERKFKHEFDVACRLSHPNIPKIYDFGHIRSSARNRNIYYFTMEFLPYGDLLDVSVDLSIHEIETLLLESLRALAYLNNHGLLHLDIKPKNLLIVKKEKELFVKLIDFGLATIMGTSAIGGTAHYMSPEMIVKMFKSKPNLLSRYKKVIPAISLPEPDHRSDIYSLGLTFYKALTKKNPFTGLTRYETMACNLRSNPELKTAKILEIQKPSAFNPNIPPYLDDVIMRMIRFHPDERYQTPIEALEALTIRASLINPPSQDTYYSYIPKYIGRDKIHNRIESIIQNVAQGVKTTKPIICISAAHGMGKTILLNKIKSFLQRNDFTTHFFDYHALTSSKEVANISCKHSSALLIDDIDLVFRKSSQESKNGLINALENFIANLKSQHKQKNLKQNQARSVMLFTVDPQHSDIKHIRERLRLTNDCVTLITLPPFSDSDTSEFLEYIFGSHPNEEYVTKLQRLTGGNPRVMRDLFQEAIKSGKLFGADRRPSIDLLTDIGFDFEHITPPKSLLNHINSHLSALSTEAQSVAKLMACFGDEIGLSDINAFLKWNGKKNDNKTSPSWLNIHPHIKNISDELRSSELFSCEHANKPFFANTAILRVIASGISEKDSHAIHKKIAGFYRHKKAKQEIIDYHLARDSSKSRRIDSLRRLIAHALSQSQSHEAIEYIERLVPLLSEKNTNEKLELVISLSNEYAHMNQYPKAINALTKTSRMKIAPVGNALINLQLAWLNAKKRKSHSAHTITKKQIAVLISDYPILKSYERYLTGKIKKLHEQKITAKNVAPLFIFLRYHALLSYLSILDGKFLSAVESMRQLLFVAKTLPSSQRHALEQETKLGQALFYLASRSEDKIRCYISAIKVLKRERQSFKSKNDIHGEVTSLMFLAHSYRDLYSLNYKGAKQRALNYYQKGIQLANKYNLPDLLVRLYSGFAAFHSYNRHFEEAIDYQKMSYEISCQIGSMTLIVEGMVSLAGTLILAKKYQEALDYCKTALYYIDGNRGKEAGLLRSYKHKIFLTLADVYIKLNQTEEAHRYINMAKAEAKSQGETKPIVLFSIYGTEVEVKIKQHASIVEIDNLLDKCGKIAKEIPALKTEFHGLLLKYKKYKGSPANKRQSFR